MKKFRQPDSYSYKIEIIDGKEHFTVSFKDGVGFKHEISINRDTFINLKKFKLEENSQLYQMERYITHSVSTENDDFISNISFYPLPSTEETVLKHEGHNQLYVAFEMLTDTERRRFLRHVLDGKKVSEIATEEKCSHRVAGHSIFIAKGKLKKILKDFSK
jgi:DNA-directed RNA polymerase specialized sigma24 family protein